MSSRAEAENLRIQYALHGRPTDRLWTWLCERKIQVERERVAPGSEAAYRQALERESDPVYLGELVERAWGTRLLNLDDLERAWQVGSRARMAAVLDPRCERERVGEWARSLCEAGEDTTPWKPEQAMSELTVRHRWASAILIERAPVAWMETGKDMSSWAGRSDWERNLGSQWCDGDGTLVAQSLERLAGQSERYAGAARLLRRLAWQHWVQSQGVDLSGIPVPIMRALTLDAYWATSGASEMELSMCDRLWRNWDGSGAELLQAAREVLTYRQ